MHYYVIAGERSGDLHGGNLVKALKKHDPEATFRGFGGEYMESAGVRLTVHYRDMAFMGLTEILSNLNRIARYIRQCKEDILKQRPDVIILIDYGGFNRRIAKFGKQQGIKVFYYIPPKVWAWYQVRALELKANVDRLFVILPFEKDFFKKFDWDVDYVGNPVLDAVKAHEPDQTFRAKNGLAARTHIVALLPGSRKQEVKRITPLLTEVVRKFPQQQFAVAAVHNLDASLYDDLKTFNNVTLIYEDTYNLLLNAHAAIVTSGTATLETALFKVPQVVVYKANPLSVILARWLVKVPFISLVNLIAGRLVVKEMIQRDANVVAVSRELASLIDEGPYRQAMVQGYEHIIRILDTGSASENAGRLMVAYLK